MAPEGKLHHSNVNGAALPMRFYVLLLLKTYRFLFPDLPTIGFDPNQLVAQAIALLEDASATFL